MKGVKVIAFFNSVFLRQYTYVACYPYNCPSFLCNTEKFHLCGQVNISYTFCFLSVHLNLI